jgi:hypothetical protein
VLCKPMVCSRNPEPSSKPSPSPCRRSLDDSARTLAGRIAIRTAAAIPKRQARKVAGAICTSDCFVTTKVEPHTAVAAMRAITADQVLNALTLGMVTALTLPESNLATRAGCDSSDRARTMLPSRSPRTTQGAGVAPA